MTASWSPPHAPTTEMPGSAAHPHDRGVLPIVLAIGGSDSSAGAGVQADLKTVAALGGYARTVVTAVTAQHSGGVTAAWPVPTSTIEAQLRAAYLDGPPAAVKTGMLANREAVEATSQLLRELGARNLVVDPVVRSTSGATLLDAAGVDALRTLLLPLAALVTPNAAEAALLSGIAVETRADAIEAGRRILALGVGAVLVTGGHLTSDLATDILITAEGTQLFEGAYLDGPDVHGTGCAFASAIATRLAFGDALVDAIGTAKQYMAALIDVAFRSAPKGTGSAVMPDHLFAHFTPDAMLSGKSR